MGWRGPYWGYARDFDPSVASIRNDPEFKEVFAGIELAARPKEAALNVAPVR